MYGMNTRVSTFIIMVSLSICPAFALPSLSDLPPGLYGYVDPSTGKHQIHYVPDPSKPYEDPFSLTEQPLPAEFIPLVQNGSLQTPSPLGSPASSPSPASPAFKKPSMVSRFGRGLGRFMRGFSAAGMSQTYPLSSDPYSSSASNSLAPLPLMATPSLMNGPTTISQFGNMTTISTPGQLPTTATQFGNMTTINRPFQMPSTVTRFGNTWSISDPNGGLPTTVTKFGNSYNVMPPFGMPSTINTFGNSMMINTPGQMPTTFTHFGNSWLSNP